ncbi:MAG: hypothetical protein O7D34_11200 [Ignavibacteria bacterium]|nr:hypothetical protein [Ignavibacteria bacterium]
MKYKKSVVLLLLICAGFSQSSWAQACCSAGTPLLSSLELPSTARGNLQFALTYEYNALLDVLSGTRTLEDDTRRRVTHSVLLETSYGLSSTFSVSALLTLVQQERRIVSPFDGTESQLSARGIGDAVVLFKHSLVPLNIFSQLEVTIGGGAKIPLGSSTLTSGGILLPADMQPGTGAWDGILWAYGSKGFLPTLPLNIFATTSYRFTGVNDRFGGEHEGYKFGNEFIVSVGVGYRTDMLLDFSLHFRFRHTTPDQFGGSGIPNTGGDWFYLIPGINVKSSPNLTFRASGQLPVYRNLKGTQLTTSFTASLTIFYILG